MSVAAEGQIQCDHCKEWVDKRASVCPYCRKKNPSAQLNPLACGFLIGMVIWFVLVLVILEGVFHVPDSVATPIVLWSTLVLFVLSCIGAAIQLISRFRG